MTKVRAPMLLDSQMQEVRRIEPAGASIVLNLTPPSTADITVMFDRDDPIPMRSWVRLYTIHGDAGVYRVSASDTQYDSDEQRLTLEHGITSLRDTVVPSLSDRTADSEVKKTASEMLSWLLGKQNVTMWQAGNCAATENVILDQNDSSLLEMLLDMMDQLPEYDLDLDQSSFPWTVSIIEKAEGITAEGRLSRNLGSVRVTYDDSELCTRVYATGLDGGYMDADTQSTYGIVEGSLYLNSDTQREEAERIATRYLEKRKSPAISVELDAVDLSKATGETIDAFMIGKKFRLTIPTYGLIVDQWITGIRYADVYGDPEHVVLTLGNRIADIAQRASKTSRAASKAGKSASGGGGGGARSNAALIADNYREITVHNGYITALDSGLEVWRDVRSGITFEDAVVTLFSETKDYFGVHTKEEWEEEKGRKEDALRQAGINIDTTDKSLIDIYAESTIDQQSEINMRVKKDGVIAAINLSTEEGGTLKIEAAKVDLGNYATVGTLQALREEVAYLLGDTVTFQGSVWCQGGFAHTGQNLSLLNKACSWKDLEVVTGVPNSSITIYEYTFDDQGHATGKYTANKTVSINPSKETIHFIGHS